MNAPVVFILFPLVAAALTYGLVPLRPRLVALFSALVSER